jgi:hypothetical protein
MQIDESDERQQKADSPIHESREPDSNAIVDSDLDPAIHSLPSFSTDEGMQNDDNDDHQQNASSSHNFPTSQFVRFHSERSILAQFAVTSPLAPLTRGQWEEESWVLVQSVRSGF